MGKLDEQARKRLREWVSAQMTDAAFANKIGRNAVWVSRYFGQEYDADLDTLAAGAAACGHTLFELLDLHQNTSERALLDAFRAIGTTRGRELAVEVVQQMTPAGRPARTRKRNG